MVSWVVTGANRGIGLGFIKKLSSDSNNIVFALTRNKANSTDLLELASKFGNVHVHQADITDVPSLRVVAQEVEKVTGGALDVLINNGAYLAVERADWSLDMYDGKEELLDQDCSAFFNVNILGVIKTINVFLPLLRKASEKSLAKVITITSAAGDIEFNVKTATSYLAPYGISKAGVNLVSAKYAAKFKDENMLFLSLSPGAVNTLGDQPKEVQEAAYGNLVKQLKVAYPEWSGVFLLPEESVTFMLDVVSKLTAKDSGACLSHHGDTKTWL